MSILIPIIHKVSGAFDPFKFINRDGMDPQELMGRMGAGEGIFRSLYYGDSLVGMFGFVLSPGGTASVWASFSDEIKSRPLAITRFFKENVRLTASLLNVNRVQLIVATNSPNSSMSKRWAETIGFEVEGVMRNGAGKYDAILMSYIPVNNHGS